MRSPVLFAMAIAVAAGCGGSETRSVFDDPTCVSRYFPFGNGQIAYSPDGTLCATEGPTGGVVISSTADNSQKAAILQGYTNPLKALAWSRDSKTVATMWHPDGCTLWRASDGARLTAIGPATEDGHYLHSIVFSSDGKQVLAAFRGDSGRVDARFDVAKSAYQARRAE